MGEVEHLPEELVAYAVNLPWQATFTRGEVQDLVLGVPTAPVVPDRAVEERVLALLDSHVSHGGAGGGVWHADCLDVDCRWTAHGTGGLTDSMRAHQSHLAAVLARALLEDGAQ